ncbi:uncharacterized protein LOC130730317 isoform X3 [Lotus japonicus]|uniref:uncharacterized protein LOC130730317 isoform X3 n=1 Tax=Lotus japonicus TaxID=34305 RepID=UPI0025868DD9|nr:uncharacterized protein LOC130730317 isoform X3 [Lotus japonicus]XP_057438272.1 uncharacterized protein LOC130730317 isoform X3 [Lotus japonicus]
MVGAMKHALSAIGSQIVQVYHSLVQNVGKKNTETVPRFRVEVMVSYNNNSSKFVLWDRECIQLVKQTAIDLKKQLLDEGEFDAMAVPEPIDCILGKLFAFKVKVQPGYKQFSVTGVSDNEKTIESIRDKLQVDEDSLMSKKGKSISSFLKEDDAYEIQSLSATADSDTTSIGHCTPAKRLSKDTLDDDFACQDLPSVQLSSSKVTKHIKTECYASFIIIKMKLMSETSFCIFWLE